MPEFKWRKSVNKWGSFPELSSSWSECLSESVFSRIQPIQSILQQPKAFPQNLTLYCYNLLKIEVWLILKVWFHPLRKVQSGIGQTFFQAFSIFELWNSDFRWSRSLLTVKNRSLFFGFFTNFFPKSQESSILENVIIFATSPQRYCNCSRDDLWKNAYKVHVLDVDSRNLARAFSQFFPRCLSNILHYAFKKSQKKLIKFTCLFEHLMGRKVISASTLVGLKLLKNVWFQRVTIAHFKHILEIECWIEIFVNNRHPEISSNRNSPLCF